jgi:hypothetical protein
LQFLHHEALPRGRFRQITVEEGSRSLRVSGHFLMGFECVTVIRYFGVDPNLSLVGEIETLGVGCFYGLHWLSSLVFETETNRGVGIFLLFGIGINLYSCIS